MSTKQPGVYVIRNMVTGSEYVGSSVHIPYRWASHRHSLRERKKSPPKLQQAWIKYGEDAFEFVVLEYCAEGQCLVREQHYIDTRRPKYNTRDEAKSNLGIKWPDEVNAKKGRPVNTYTVNGVTGSLGVLCAHFGVVGENGALARMRKGLSVEQAVLNPPKRGSGIVPRKIRQTEKSVMFNGELLPLAVAVRKYGVVNRAAVRQRMKKGMTLEAALLTPAMGVEERVAKSVAAPRAGYHNEKDHLVAGVRGNTAELARHFGISVDVAYARFKLGWSADRVFLTPVKSVLKKAASCN